MRNRQALNTTLLLAALAALAFLVASPISAKPGWSHPVLGQLELSSEQQNEIQNLRSAFRDQFRGLDWSYDEGGHSSETLQQARELRIALREEIREVLTEQQRELMDSARKGCPYSGKRAPASASPQSATLYL